MYTDPFKDQYLFSIITFKILNSNQPIENSIGIVFVPDYAMRFLNLYKEQVQCINHLSLASLDEKKNK